MNTRAVRYVSLVIPILAGIALVPASTPADDGGSSGLLKVGTFDSRCVAFAYGQTTGPGSFFDQVQELKREYAAAERSGERERMAELQEKGESLQHEMHLKVFCGTPIDDILALIREDIPKVAQEAGLSLIVDDVLYAGPDIQIVDVSTEMAKLFTTDPEVINALPEILATPVVDAEEFERGYEHR